MTDPIIQELAYELAGKAFEESGFKEKIDAALKTVNNVQTHIAAIDEKRDEGMLLQLKAGTVLTMEVCERIACGKQPKDFTEEDWKAIAEAVGEKAMLKSSRDYSRMVFTTYAQYIEVSAKKYEGRLSDKTIAAVREIATQIREKEKMLSKCRISEVEYTEDCLWLSAEAMLKLLSATALIVAEKEASELADAITTFGFAYARLKMNEKHKALVESYLANQKQLDEKLQREYNEYTAELEANALEFNKLLDEAFDADFGDKLRASVALARAAGVSEEEILVTVEDVDDFFM